jgi:hypothetical protein
MFKLTSTAVLTVIALAAPGTISVAQAEHLTTGCGVPCQRCRAQLGMTGNSLPGQRSTSRDGRAWEACMAQARSERDRARPVARAR